MGLERLDLRNALAIRWHQQVRIEAGQGTPMLQGEVRTIELIGKVGYLTFNWLGQQDGDRWCAPNNAASVTGLGRSPPRASPGRSCFYYIFILIKLLNCSSVVLFNQTFSILGGVYRS